MSESPSRRSFLQSSVAVGAAAIAVPSILAANANEKLNVGLIGCGNRGKALIREVLKLKHNVVAICDIAAFRLNEVAKIIALTEQKEPASEYAEFRKLLECEGLDAVVIATPDHHHRDMLIAAVDAGKDAYIEKPLSKLIEEGREMIEAVRKAKRIVQVGNQRHSGPHWRRGRDVIESNDFGNLVFAKVWDTRNWVKHDPFAVPESFTKDQEKQLDWTAFLGKAPKREFNANRYWAWRWYWDYAGGLMTDIGAHQLDVVQWLGGIDAPKSVMAHGGRYHFKHWETPDVLSGTWDYGSFAATFHVEFINGADGAGATFYGTKQTLVADADKEIRLYNTTEKITPDTEPKEVWKIESETSLHVKNWLECCKSRKEPNSPVELGHKVVVAAHLANLSYRSGKRVYWDTDRQEVIGG